MAFIEYQNVTKRYGDADGAVVALKDVNMEIDRGEFVAIVGPSGCGKSTALHITAGLTSATEGAVFFDDVDTSRQAVDRSEIGMVFQKPILLEWRTVLKNVLLPIEIMAENGNLNESEECYRERAVDLLDSVGLGDFQDSYPSELSGGMQQRASICRCLVFDPSVLLMDEPFGALDEFTRESLNKELLSIWDQTGKTILFVTHNIEEAAYLSDRVIVLGSRPGTVQGNIHIEIDRPRNPEIRTTPEFNEYVSEISDTLGSVSEL